MKTEVVKLCKFWTELFEYWNIYFPSLSILCFINTISTLISNCQSLFRINSSHPHVNRWNTRLWRIFILSRFATRLCGIFILSRLAHNNKGCLLTRLLLNYQDVIYTLLLLVPIIWSPIYRESAMYSTPAYFRCQASNNARYVCFVTILC